MIAIEIREPGDPDVLIPIERPIPTPGSGEVLIEVAAAGVNRPERRHHRNDGAKAGHEGTKARRPERREALIVWWSSTRAAERRSNGRHGRRT